MADKLYRIHDKLLIDAKHGEFLEGGPGVVHTLSRISQNGIKALLKNGNISEVQAPPLETFADWTGRARTLGALGIDTIGLIVMDARDVAYAILAARRKEGADPDVFSAKVDKLTPVVKRWQGEMMDLLGIDTAKTWR